MCIRDRAASDDDDVLALDRHVVRAEQLHDPRRRAGQRTGRAPVSYTHLDVYKRQITDNAIIPLKERVVDADYDPIAWLGRKILRRTKRSATEAAVQPAP